MTMEVLDPEDKVVGRVERRAEVAEGTGRWQEQIKLEKPLALDDIVCHRVRYHFEYSDQKNEALEGTESISQILRTPVVHIRGQQSYLTGGGAAVGEIIESCEHDILWLSGP